MESIKFLINKIINYQKKKLAYIIAANVINLLIVFLVIWLGVLVLDELYYFSFQVRWILLFVIVLLSVFLLTYAIIIPVISLVFLKENSDLTGVTREIGSFYPEIRDRLTNIYQLATTRVVGASNSLKNYAITAFVKKIDVLDFSLHVYFKKLLLPIPVLLSVFIGSIFLILIMPNALQLSLKRIMNPSAEYSSIPEYTFIIKPGNAKIIMGKSQVVQALYRGPNLQNVFFEYRSPGEPIFQKMPMSYQKDSYICTLKDIRRPIEYQIRGIAEQRAEWYDELVSDRYQLTLIIPPMLTDLLVTITPPTYTKLPKHHLEKNVGDIITYPGARAAVSASTNKDIRQAKIIFSDNVEIDANVRANKISAEFNVHSEKSYHFKIYDYDGIENQTPIEYSINMLTDQYPIIEIVEPGGDIDISADAALNLVLAGSDDFGFSILSLQYQILSSIEAARDTNWYKVSIAIPRGEGKFFQQTYLWNFATLPVGFGDVVKYYVTLFDNDQVNGPKISRSQEFLVRFPSLEQLFEEFTDKQDQSQNNLEQISDENEEIQKKLEEINREIKRDRELDWERKKEIESTLEKQRNINDKIEKIQKELDQAIKKLEQNQLLSPEIFDKYRKLQELFKDIATPELLQAMEELQHALEDLNKDQVQKSLQNFKFNQEQFKENLDRTLELFERVRLEQQIDQMVKLAEKMTQEQEKITQKLNLEKPLDSKQIEQLNKQEELQRNSLEHSREILEDILRNNLILEHPKTRDQLEQARDYIDEQNLSENLKQLQQQLKSGQQVQAANASNQSSKDLKAYHQMLMNAQQEMIKSGQIKIMAQMQNTTEKLLKLSVDEEQLMTETKDLSNFSDQFNRTAAQQQDIAENMGRVIKDIIDLSQKTFFISPEMNKSLGEANSSMYKSLKELEERNQTNASKFQGKAMSALNAAAMQMQNSMQMMAQSGSVLGFEQFLKRMQQMAGQQGQLNEQGLNLFNSGGNNGSLTLEQQNQLRRMAAEQSAIQRSLEQLHDEIGNRSDILGRLDNMSQEMEEVIKDLESLKIDRKTIARQEKILSRMLDAQKSVREKEYSRKRKAEIGKEYVQKSPSENLDILDAQAEKLRLSMMQALQEGYNPDYEKIIEDYFRQLTQKQISD